ncbi:MAG TPA: TadE family protein [Sporichthyaceae bacterium]|jgi:hypothetical protein|nr:TadE family protein [Sporichthyaceae bacterium]
MITKKAPGPRDAGTSTVELAITTPVLLLAILTVVQIGLWFHTRQVALTAAQDGLRIARAHGGTATDARERALADLHVLAPKLLTHPDVEVTRGTDTASVDVRGRATSILGILSLPVHEHAAGPVERFVPAAGGFSNPENTGPGSAT